MSERQVGSMEQSPSLLVSAVVRLVNDSVGLVEEALVRVRLPLAVRRGSSVGVARRRTPAHAVVDAQRLRNWSRQTRTSTMNKPLHTGRTRSCLLFCMRACARTDPWWPGFLHPWATASCFLFARCCRKPPRTSPPQTKTQRRDRRAFARP